MNKKIEQALWLYAASSFMLVAVENAGQTALGKYLYSEIGYEDITFWTLIFGGIQTASSHLIAAKWWKEFMYRHWRAVIIGDAIITLAFNALVVADVIPFKVRWIATTIVLMVLSSTLGSFWEFMKQDSGRGESISILLSKWMVTGMFVGRAAAWAMAAGFNYEPTVDQIFAAHLMFAVLDNAALFNVIVQTGCMSRRKVD